MSEAHTAWSRIVLRIIGLLIAFGLLIGLASLPERARGKGFEFKHKKNRFQKIARKKINLSDIRQANLLPVTSPVVINEIGLANPLGPLDEAGNPADWIELYNKSGHPVSLKDCTLTDSMAQNRKWILPDIEMPPKSYLLVWVDGESRISSPLEVDVTENGDWFRFRDEFRTQSGYAWYSSNNIPPEKREPPAEDLTGDFQVDEPGDYCLWLRVHNTGKKAATLQCRVDDGKPFPAAVKPSRNYAMVRIYNPRQWRGYWPLDTEGHSLAITLAQGEVCLDKIILTRSDAMFGMTNPTVHANFKLNNEGELVALYSPQGIPLDYVDFPALPPGKTFSRVPAGANHLQKSNPTPLGHELTLPPRLSLNSGYLEKPAHLVASKANSRDTIRYTLDGSDPVQESPGFPDDLVITQKCVIRARSFRPGAVPSAVETRVFWAGPRPEVPVLWCVMDPANLWDSQRGIMLNYQARGINSERPCYAAFFCPDGSVQAASIGLRNQGRGSRMKSHVRSFRVTCRTRYGSERWPGSVFEGDGPDELTSFTVRANNLIAHPLGMEIMQSAGFLSPRSRHCLVYMNNEPYGVYFLLEDVERPEFIRHHFGHLNIDMIKHKTLSDPLIYGKWDEYEKTWAAMSGGSVQLINRIFPTEVMDLSYFSRWIAAAIFMNYGDNDQTYFVFNKRAPAPAWSFINWDTDGCFYYSYVGRTNTVSDTSFIEGVRRRVFSGLLEDENYPNFYLSEFQRLMNHVTKPDRWLKRLADYEHDIMPYVDLEYQGLLNQNRLGRDDDIGEEVKLKDVRSDLENDFKTLRRFFKTRPAEARALFKSERNLPDAVTIDVESSGEITELMIDGWPETPPYKGYYFPGTAFSITAASNNPPLRLTVNGKPVPGGTFETEIAGPLVIKAGFSSSLPASP